MYALFKSSRVIVASCVGLAGIASVAVAAGAVTDAPSRASIPQLAPPELQPPFLPDTPGPERQFKLTPEGGIPFPKDLDSQPGLRHRSGGPYVSADYVRKKASDLLECGSRDPLRQCDQVVVKFFPRYQDAAEAHLKSGAFASGLASDREVYLVSVKGKLDMPRRSMQAQLRHNPMTFVVDHWNYQVDAATGDFMAGGTAGDVLNESG